MIPVNEPLLCGNELRYLTECIETGWISSEGPFVEKFESSFAASIGCKHGIAVSNGSAALEVALEALEIGPGDEVILPTFTIISCISAVIRSGATPVLIDCQPDTWNMNVDQLRDRITPKTKAIMVVHIYGLPVDMDPVIDLSEQFGTHIIEDAAEAHGLNYKGRPCGSVGVISTFSFYANKLVTTGEGGMLVTDDPVLEERCRSLRNLCFKPEQRFVHDRLGWNFRMTNLQAAVGLAQLEQIDEFVERKRRTGRLYTELLSDIDGLQLPLRDAGYAENLYWVYGVVLSDDLPMDAKTVMERLGRAHIGTRPFFWPLHQQPVVQEMGLFTGQNFPVAERLARRGFYLPSGLAISEDQIRKVAQQLRLILQ